MKGGFVVGCRKYKQITGKLKEQLKKAYLTTDTTYEKLADEYGVSVNSLSGLAADEKWREQKQDFAKKLTKKTIEKLSDKISDKRSDIAGTIYETSKNLADKAAKIIAESNETTELVNASKLLKSACELLGVKSPEEMRLQEAQREKIEAETDLAKSKVNGDTTDDGGITLIITR